MAKKPARKLKALWLNEAYAPSIWDIGNGRLYTLCRRYADHTKKKAIAAKVWLIGRAYSVAIERGVAGKGKADEFITKTVVPKIRRSPLDRWLDELPRRPARLRNNLQSVAKTHKQLEQRLAEICGRRRESFTSKYLHFHRPDLFPISDSRAKSAIAQITPDARFCARDLQLRAAKSDYEKFAVRCAWLSERMAEKRGRVPTLRQVDQLLLCVYRKLKHR